MQVLPQKSVHPPAFAGLTPTERHRLEQRIRAAQLGHSAWITFPGLGDHGASIVFRLLLLWILAVPLLLLRSVLAIALLWATMGFFQLATSTATVGGGVLFQMYYREVVHFATTSPSFQRAWDVMATAMALTLSVFVWTIRLLVEIHNGFCPLYSLLADALLILFQQLAVVWYAAPVLQYFLTWLIRLAVYLVEPVLDCLVTVFETFMYLVRELQSVAPASGGIPIDDGEVLLEVVVIICTVLVRIAQALLIAFAPLLYGFFRMILPMILPLMPMVLDMVVNLVNILASPAMKRIVFFALESIPILLESLGAIVCDLVVYLGSAFCYLLYSICIILSFVLKYILRPLVCGTLPVFAACQSEFIKSMFDGESCYSCNGYNTACGCRKNYNPYQSSQTLDAKSKPQCDGDICWNKIDPLTFAAKAAPNGSNVPDVQRVVADPFTYNAPPTTSTSSDDAMFSFSPGQYGTGDVNIDSRRRGVTYVTAQPTELQRTALVVGSPNFYAPIQASYAGSSAYTWGAMPVYPSGAALPTICDKGVGLGCTLTQVRADLMYSANSGAHTLSATGSWAPVTWFDGNTTTPWLHMQLAQISNVTSIEIRWKTSAGIAYAPTAMTFDTDSGDHWRVDGLQCHMQQSNRQRMDSVPRVANGVSWIRLAFLLPCNHGVVDHIPTIYMYSIRLLGQPVNAVGTTPPRVTDQGTWQIDTTLTDALIWDSCGTGTMDGILDGARMPLPVALIASKDKSATARLLIHPTVSRKFEARLVIIRFTGTGRVSRGAAWLCPVYNSPPTFATSSPDTLRGCIKPVERDTTNTGPLRDFRYQSLSELSGASNASVFSAEYYQRVDDPGLYNNLMFELPTGAQQTALELWISDFTDTRCTTWETSLVESQLSPVLFASGDIIETIQQQMSTVGGLAAKVRRPGVPIDVCGNTTRLADVADAAKIATYATPLQGSACARSLMFGDLSVYGPMVVTSASRRLQSIDSPDPKSADDVMEDELRARSTSWERRSELQDSVPIHVIMRHHSADSFANAPQTHRHQPFAPDIRMMPDPHSEPVIKCTQVSGGMKCRHRDLLRLGSHAASESTVDSHVGVFNHDTPSNELSTVHARLHQQREISATVRRNSHIHQMFPPVEQPPSSMSSTLSSTMSTLSSAMRKLQFFGGDDIMDDLMDKVKDVFYGLLGCASGEDIWKCLMRPVIELLKSALVAIAALFDSLAALLLSAMGIDRDIISVAACTSCSLTTAAVGVLADFMDDFPLSACNDVVDRGQDGCEAVGFSASGGSGVFEGVWGMLKILIGSLQVLAPFGEVVYSMCTVVLGTAVQLFPTLKDDLIEIYAFFLTAGGAIVQLEVMMEALVDPVMDDVPALFRNRAQSQHSNPNTVVGVGLQSPLAAATCPGVENATQCTQVGAPGGAASQVAKRILASGGNGQVTKDDLTFGDLGGCGCHIEAMQCEGGIGGDSCPVQQGDYTSRQQADQLAWAAADPTDCDTWPECAPRVLVTGHVESGEMVRQCMSDHKCKMMVRAPNPTSTNTATDFKSTFGAFSLNNGLNRKGAATPGRRRCPEGQRQGDAPWSHGCTPDYSKYMSQDRRLMSDVFPAKTSRPQTRDPGYVPRHKTLYVANRGFQTMMNAGKNSYATRQVTGLRHDIAAMFALYTNVTTKLNNDKRWPTSARIEAVVGHSMRHARGLFGTSLEEDARKIGCGWVPPTSADSLLPNTYPCCKGMWCCIPPPFADDFYPVKVSTKSWLFSLTPEHRTGSRGEMRGTKTPSANTCKTAWTPFSSWSGRPPRWEETCRTAQSPSGHTRQWHARCGAPRLSPATSGPVRTTTCSPVSRSTSGSMYTY